MMGGVLTGVVILGDRIGVTEPEGPHIALKLA